VFNHNSFLPKSFFSGSFELDGGTPEPSSGHSGYWRLFYYQLQEKEYLKRTEKATTKIEGTLPPEKEKVARAPGKEPGKLPEISTPPFPKLPAFTPIKEVLPSPLIELWQITLNVRMMVAKYNNIKVQSDLDHIAVNDDENDVELLLLLAA